MEVCNGFFHDVHPGRTIHCAKANKKRSTFFEALVPVLRYEALWESAQAKANPMNKEEAG